MSWGRVRSPVDMRQGQPIRWTDGFIVGSGTSWNDRRNLLWYVILTDDDDCLIFYQWIGLCAEGKLGSGCWAFNRHCISTHHHCQFLNCTMSENQAINHKNPLTFVFLAKLVIRHYIRSSQTSLRTTTYSYEDCVVIRVWIILRKFSFMACKCGHYGKLKRKQSCEHRMHLWWVNQ